MTYADDFSLRNPTLYSATNVAAAIDGLLTRRFAGGTSGSSNNYTATVSPAPTAYEGGQVFILFPNHTNTGSATLNVNSLGPKTIKYLGHNLVGGELVTNVYAYLFYNNTDMILLNHGGGWATWTPTYGATGSMTFTSVTTVYAKYQRHGKRVRGIINANGTTGGTASTGLTFTLPVTAANTDSGGALGHCVIGEAGTVAGFMRWSSTTVAICERYDQANISLAAGRALSGQFEYEC
jgi:hypothetical protein